MNGNLRERLRVRDDLLARLGGHLRLSFPNTFSRVGEATSPEEQLTYWKRRLASPSFVYFIQHGEAGPIKIGKAVDPARCIGQLQTGNPEELVLRSVVPGDRAVEGGMHRRFEPARIRGEWFGAEYLPMIRAYAAGIAEQVLYTHDGSDAPPVIAVDGAVVRSQRDTLRLRAQIERCYTDGHTTPATADLLGMSITEVEYHLDAMQRSPLYKLRRPSVR
jgi:hypothetical protein